MPVQKKPTPKHVLDNKVRRLTPRERFAVKIGDLQASEQQTLAAIERTKYLYPRTKPTSVKPVGKPDVVH